MIQVSLTFNSTADLMAFFAGAAREPSPVKVEAVASPVVVPPATIPADIGTKPRKPYRGEKTSSMKPGPVVPAGTPPVQVETTTAAVVEPKTAADPVPPLDVAKGDPLPENMAAPTYTENEVRDHLKKVSEKFGILEVSKMLNDIAGKARISEVPADKYAALVDAAKAKVAA